MTRRRTEGRTTFLPRPAGAPFHRPTSRSRRALRALAASAALLTVTALSPAARAAPEPKAPAEFVALRSVDPSILQEMRYLTPHDFVGEPIDGYRQPLCILTRPAAEALHRAQVRLLRQGYSLKVYDCYRPQRAVDHFVRWAKDLDDERMKAEFYPRVDKSRLFADGYIAEKSGHSRGSTMDLTIVRLPAPPTRPYHPGQRLVPCYAPKGERFPDNSVDMGTGFDCFDTLAHTDDPRIQGAQRANRQLLKTTLAAEGFANLPEEWWHFTYRPEPFPDTYFDFPVARRSVAGH
ncbi:M15 family metallopeptidase [Streptomyces sp. ASQP_92]|uniref:M15 family metallopeptidase n=1 Tax=Streptomyces sp. ASQP_92 TaxID=2979116 RepID=UPI0021C12BD4|nr:M15 family metallopeptidase [Streptomyces sp. ASQP_92]MCT9093992.1 M15 family metallopeptidase [Streptomyces sp. ASQP_92]